MRNSQSPAFSIARRELKAYFTGPIAYIVITIFLIITGVLFFNNFFLFNQAEMRNLFQLLPFMFTFAAPAVTMRLFSEERYSGSFEILMTFPVSTLQVVIGKFIAAMVFLMVMITPTLVYLFTILLVGRPDMGPIIGGYAGAILLGGASASVGLLTSAASKNQIVALMTGFALNFFLWLLGKIVIYLPDRLAFLQYLSTDFHFRNISRGVIDLRDIIYFLSIIALSILVTVKIIDERR